MFDAPYEQAVLGSLLPLETETSARLRPAVAGLGIDAAEAESAQANGGGGGAMQALCVPLIFPLPKVEWEA